MRVAAFAAAVVVLLTTAQADARRADDPPLFRVFLTDGRSLTSFGEWSRVADKVVFSLPLAEGPTPDLQLVSLGADRVDWPRTERYASTVRAVHYAATRAEDDYATFSNQVAAVLTSVAKEPDATRRLAIAESARTALAAWPRQHYGYRAADVQQMLSLLDEVIADLRGAAGQPAFELNLVAATLPPAPDTLLPASTTAGLADELLLASTLAESPAEKTTLLERVVSLIDRAAGLLPESWATRVRTTARSSITSERATDRAYAKLAASVLTRAAQRARAADVRGLERLRADVLTSDSALGRQRPAELSAMLAAVDTGADTARRLRLARDQWRLLEPAFRSYQKAVSPALRELDRATATLEDIRAQAGPTPATITRTRARLLRAKPAVLRTNPPAALASAHALLTSAWDLADQALALRLRAVELRSAERAGEASAAAAGALLLAARVRGDITEVVKVPSIP